MIMLIVIVISKYLSATLNLSVRNQLINQCCVVSDMLREDTSPIV